MLLSGIYYGKTPISRAYKNGEIIWSFAEDHLFCGSGNIAFGGIAMITQTAWKQFKTEYNLVFENKSVTTASDSALINPVIFWTSSLPESLINALASGHAIPSGDIDTSLPVVGTSLPSATSYVGVCVASGLDGGLNTQDSCPMLVLTALYTGSSIDLRTSNSNVTEVDENADIEGSLLAHSVNSAPVDTDTNIDIHSESHVAPRPSAVNDVSEDIKIASIMQECSDLSAVHTVEDDAGIYNGAFAYTVETQPLQNDINERINECMHLQRLSSQEAQAEDDADISSNASIHSSDAKKNNIEEQIVIHKNIVANSSQSTSAFADSNTRYKLKMALVGMDSREQLADVEIAAQSLADVRASGSLDIDTDNHIFVDTDSSLMDATVKSQQAEQIVKFATESTQRVSDIDAIPSQDAVSLQSDAAISPDDSTLLYQQDCIVALKQGDTNVFPSKTQEHTLLDFIDIPAESSVHASPSDAKVIDMGDAFDINVDLIDANSHQAVIDMVDTTRNPSALYSTSGLPTALDVVDELSLSAQILAQTPHMHQVDMLQHLDSQSTQRLGTPNHTQIDSFVRSDIDERMLTVDVHNHVVRYNIDSRSEAFIDPKAPLYYQADAILWSDVQAFMRQLSGRELDIVADIISKGETTLTANKLLGGFITDLCLRNKTDAVVVSSNIVSTIINVVMQDAMMANAAYQKFFEIENIVSHAWNMTVNTSVYSQENIVITEWDTICSVANMVRTVYCILADQKSAIETNCSFTCRATLSTIPASNWEWPVRRNGTDLLITQVFEVDRDGTSITLF